MQVELIDFVTVPTRDTARAVAWHRDVLGLPVSEVTEGEVETPNVTLSSWEQHADPPSALRGPVSTRYIQKRR